MQSFHPREIRCRTINSTGGGIILQRSHGVCDYTLRRVHCKLRTRSAHTTATFAAPQERPCARPPLFCALTRRQSMEHTHVSAEDVLGHHFAANALSPDVPYLQCHMNVTFSEPTERVWREGVGASWVLRVTSLIVAKRQSTATGKGTHRKGTQEAYLGAAVTAFGQGCKAISCSSHILILFRCSIETTQQIQHGLHIPCNRVEKTC